MRDENVSLREYVDIRFEAQKEAVTAALAAADRAVAKAEYASEKRFDSVNEFRAALADSARLLMPRSEAEQSAKILNEKVDLITSRLNAREDRARGLGVGWGYLVGAIGLISMVGTLIYAMTRSH